MLGVAFSYLMHPEILYILVFQITTQKIQTPKIVSTLVKELADYRKWLYSCRSKLHKHEGTLFVSICYFICTVE